jgi:hypothetical protein
MKTITHPTSAAQTPKEFIFLLVQCLSWIKQQHPSLSDKELLSLIGCPNFPVYRELLSRGTCRCPGSETDAIHEQQILDVLTSISSGTWSIDVIAAETNLDGQTVQLILDHLSGYGMQPYGASFDGRCKKISKEGSPVQRRVSSIGQMTYRGQVYTLGKKFRGSVASIVDQGKTLFISCPNRPSITITNRTTPDQSP